MTIDEFGLERIGLDGRLPDRKTVIETVQFLCYLTALIGVFSLLITIELFVRL